MYVRNVKRKQTSDFSMSQNPIIVPPLKLMLLRAEIIAWRASLALLLRIFQVTHSLFSVADWVKAASFILTCHIGFLSFWQRAFSGPKHATLSSNISSSGLMTVILRFHRKSESGDNDCREYTQSAICT